MIDFHSHILPGIDDGSKHVSESVELLRMLAEQQVKTAIATPHFDADRYSVEGFIARRSGAYEALAPSLSNELPEIRCGAEVSYYPGISRLPELKRLCIEGSKILLMEMPMSRWTEYTLKELVELSGYGGVTLALAHVERYRKFQDANTFERLLGEGVLMQCNASFFLEFSTKRKAISMLANGEIHLIGSDCHNLTSRPPKIGKAFDVIKNKLGDGFLSQLNKYEGSLLN